MPVRIAINGFGRMGKLALRAGWKNPDVEFVAINEVKGGADLAALICAMVYPLMVDT